MILVSGGTGLLGAHLLADLVKQKQEIRAIYRSEQRIEKARNIFGYYFNEPEEAFRHIQWVNADMLDVSSLAAAFQGVKQVYHCAAMVSFDPAERSKIIKTNVQGTANMINLALENQVEKFCHVSSIATVGNIRYNTRIKEDDDFKTDAKNSGYALSKYLSELEVWRGVAEGLNAVIVNPSIILGPGDWENGSGKLLKSLNKGFPFYPTGKTGFVDVRDVSKAMIALMDNPVSNERFLISENNYFYKEILGSIAKALNKKPPTIRTNSFLSGIAWRVEAIRTFFNGRRPVITRESVMSSSHEKEFSSTKLIEAIQFNYTPVEETIKHTAECFFQDQVK